MNLILTVVVVGMAITIGAGLIMYSKLTSSAAAASSRLQHLGESIKGYRDVHGSFPPAVVYDDTGRPMHSWRTLIAPYHEANYFGEVYDLTEPWDGEHNCSLHNELYLKGKDGTHDVDVTAIRDVYCSPRTGSRTAPTSDYFMVIDSSTPPVPVSRWKFARYAKPGWAAQPCGPPVLVVEVLGRSIHWMAPREMDLVDAIAIAARRSRHESCQVVGGVVVARDGNIEVLDESEVLKRLQEMAEMK